MKVLHRNGEMTDVSFECPEGRAAFWHTSAHILAQAVHPQQSPGFLMSIIIS